MSVYEDPAAYRKMRLGPVTASKATGTLAATTIDLFVIAGGEVLLTALYGKVTTAITVANSYKLTATPTAGDSVDLCQATDIGTTDTAAGTLLGFQFDQDGTTNTPVILKGSGQILQNIPLTTGKITHTSAGTDGAITWYATWVPLTAGATLVAA
jgi:hypothetical protein